MPAMKSLPLTLLALLLLLPAYGHAERRANNGDQALKRMQYMLKQLQQNNQALEDEKKKLDKELTQAKQDLDKRQQEIDRKKASIERFQLSNESLNKRIAHLDSRNAKTVERLKELIGKYRDLVLLVRELKASQQSDAATISSREHRIDMLEKKNLALYRLNQQLMLKYRDKGLLATLEQHEPFTGIKKVEMENLLQEFRLRNENNRAATAENKAGMAR